MPENDYGVKLFVACQFPCNEILVWIELVFVHIDLQYEAIPIGLPPLFRAGFMAK